MAPILSRGDRGLEPNNTQIEELLKEDIKKELKLRMRRMLEEFPGIRDAVASSSLDVYNLEDMLKRAEVVFYAALEEMGKRFSPASAPSPEGVQYIVNMAMFHVTYATAEQKGCVDLLTDGVFKIYDMLLRIPDVKKGEGEQNVH